MANQWSSQTRQDPSLERSHPGWNQYLWPLLVTNTPTMTTIVIGIRQMIGNGDAQTAWHLVMATALLAVLPPIAVVLAMQRWFVQGLIETEK